MSSTAYTNFNLIGANYGAYPVTYTRTEDQSAELMLLTRGATRSKDFQYVDDNGHTIAIVYAPVSTSTGTGLAVLYQNRTTNSTITRTFYQGDFSRDYIENPGIRSVTRSNGWTEFSAKFGKAIGDLLVAVIGELAKPVADWAKRQLGLVPAAVTKTTSEQGEPAKAADITNQLNTTSNPLEQGEILLQQAGAEGTTGSRRALRLLILNTQEKFHSEDWGQ